jgi:hypothetical protein
MKPLFPARQHHSLIQYKECKDQHLSLEACYQMVPPRQSLLLTKHADAPEDGQIFPRAIVHVAYLCRQRIRSYFAIVTSLVSSRCLCQITKDPLTVYRTAV